MKDDETGKELRDYLRAVVRRKGLVAVCAILVAGVAFVSAEIQTPKYVATASLVIQPNASESLFNPAGGAQAVDAATIATQIQLVRSQPVKQAVAKKLGMALAPAVSVSEVALTDVVNIAATNTDAQTAATIANVYANAYVDFRRTQQVNDQLAAAGQIQGRIADLQNQINALNAQMPQGGHGTPSPTLTAQVDSLIQQQGAFKQQLGQLQVETSVNNGGAQLVTLATAPTTPSSPKPTSDAILGLILGLMFGTGIALLADYFDDTIHAKDDLDRHGRSLPTLGMVPLVTSWKSKSQAYVVSVTDPKAPAAEAYRSLRTSIQFASLDRPIQTLQITSPASAEGKTTTLANLGVALAEVGQEVIIVCCDLRRPRLHEFFGLDNVVGFTSVLLGDVPLSAALQKVPGVPGLRLLASGPLPPNPSELLSSRRTTEVLAAAKAQADIVLVDSPPTLPVTDAALLASRVDATLIVATAGRTTKAEFARTLELLAQVEAPVIGFVLNGAGGAGDYGYTGGYYRYEPRPRRLLGRKPAMATAGEAPTAAVPADAGPGLPLAALPGPPGADG